MNKNKIITAILSIVIAGGAIFSSCKKEQEPEVVTAKTEKVNIPNFPDPSNGIFEVTDYNNDYCSAIFSNWFLFPTDFVISYIDDSGVIKLYFVKNNSELGQKLRTLFLQKVETFKGTEEEYCKWSTAQEEKGNIVVGYKGDDGLYHGKSYTRNEWDSIIRP